MSEITRAIAARQAQITQLQSEIDALQRAASMVGPPATAAAKPKPKRKRQRKATAKPAATSQPKRPKAKPQLKAKPKPKPKAKGKSHRWTAAEKAAIGKRMKAYWAKRRKAKG